MLDPPSAAGDWARIHLTVQSRVSSVIGTFTIWIAHHPGDTNQDGIVNVRDATAFGNEFRGEQRRGLIDLNGDGVVNIRDATTFGQIWRGEGGNRPWQGSTLPPKPE